MSRSFEAGLASLTAYGESSLALLEQTLTYELRQCHSFLTVLNSTATRNSLQDKKVFSDLINYAINSGIVDQATIAEHTRYEKSQIGRWKKGEAAPPLRMREVVIDDLAKIVQRRFEALKHAAPEGTRYN